MTAYYNEHDPFAAAWLRVLIKAGLIAPGVVDERSIEDVAPADLDGFRQVHLFAGIGVWSWALRCAGWPDDWDIWSISCPCQPFSAAGKGAGFADKRHLWPAAFHLIRAKRPVAIVGEQVASADGLAWLDLVFSDLEGEAYTVGAVDTCAAGFGAPHIRQRLYWVADMHRERLHGEPVLLFAGRQEQARAEVAWGSGPGLLADTMLAGRAEGWAGAGLRKPRGMADTDHAERRPDHAGGDNRDGQEAGRQQGDGDASARGRAGDLGNPGRQGLPQLQGKRGEAEGRTAGKPGRSFWADAEWLPCRDGKARPVEPGTFPLAHGATARVGRLRGYGNALVAPQAEGFVRAFMEVRSGRALPPLAGEEK